MNDDADSRDRIGRVLNDKWTLEKLLGIGGMGAVYEARHRNGARAAVKVLHADLARHPDVRDRFLREGYAANKVEHSGAVKVIDDDKITTGPDAGTAYLVMELLVGESLEDRVERGPQVGERELLRIADAVLDVLEAAHERGVVHRDLKPENIFLAKDDSGETKVKVLDFGLARLRDTATTTMHGVAVGTPSYMSPEQASGRHDEIDGRADLFSLAASAFRLATGRRIHEGGNAVELVTKMANLPAPKIRTVAPQVSEPFARVIDKALSFRKEDRYEDAAAMREDVRRARRELDDLPPNSRAFAEAPTIVAMAPGVGAKKEPTIELSGGDLVDVNKVAARPSGNTVDLASLDAAIELSARDLKIEEKRDASDIPEVSAAEASDSNAGARMTTPEQSGPTLRKLVAGRDTVKPAEDEQRVLALPLGDPRESALPLTPPRPPAPSRDEREVRPPAPSRAEREAPRPPAPSRVEREAAPALGERAKVDVPRAPLPSLGERRQPGAPREPGAPRIAHSIPDEASVILPQERKRPSLIPVITALFLGGIAVKLALETKTVVPEPVAEDAAVAAVVEAGVDAMSSGPLVEAVDAAPLVEMPPDTGDASEESDAADAAIDDAAIDGDDGDEDAAIEIEEEPTRPAPHASGAPSVKPTPKPTTKPTTKPKPKPHPSATPPHRRH